MSFFVNRSPTQHASTIDYNRLRITQRLPVPPVMQPFFSSSSFGRRGSQGTRTPAPDALGSVARSLPPPPCKPWPPGDLSGRVQATARRRSQIPARRREGERPRRQRAVRLHLQDFGTSASWLRPSPATASCLSRVNANAEFSFNIKINETKRNIAERLHQLLPSTRTSTWLCLLALRCPPPDCSVPRGHLPSRTKPPVRSPD